MYLFKNLVNYNTFDFKFVEENFKQALNTFIINNKRKMKLQ